MQKKKQFLICKYCGNVVEMLEDSGVSVVCCGEAMAEEEGNIDGISSDIHLPQCHRDGNILHVQVGENPHSMQKEHAIHWVWLETRQGGQRKIPPEQGPAKVTFMLETDDEPISIYVYCNVHGLWKKEIKNG